jgi:hypothetical protein
MRFRVQARRYIQLLVIVVLTVGTMGEAQTISSASKQTQATTQQRGQQPTQQGDIAQIFFQAPKPDQAQQFEAARKKHMAWHGSQNDRWSWQTFEIISGERAGGFIVGSFGHDWADFDGREEFERADEADVATNLASLTAASGGPEFWRIRRDMSPEPIPQEGSQPLATITHFMLHPGMTTPFVDTIKRITAALQKSNYAGGRGVWYELVNGGETPHFVVVTPRRNFAELRAQPTTMREAVQQVLGPQQTNALYEGFARQVKTMRTEMIRSRPDLSYNPTQR